MSFRNIVRRVRRGISAVQYCELDGESEPGAGENFRLGVAEEDLTAEYAEVAKSKALTTKGTKVHEGKSTINPFGATPRYSGLPKKEETLTAEHAETAKLKALTTKGTKVHEGNSTISPSRAPS